ncbi:2-oxo acid dehydrogenase subunit E2 [Streptomyces sp. NPDC085612]|uniref:2-oxo acid dehydrogenase subunit E2 n=1 Tax=Streptomyces sp. NPDC085612 TaxID=3365732 RepID=UPI0037D23989
MEGGPLRARDRSPPRYGRLAARRRTGRTRPRGRGPHAPGQRHGLSADHRATDGAAGARFLTALDRLLQHPEDL